MRNSKLRLWAMLAGLGAFLLWSCRGKEGPQGPQGPQGPSGQNLTRTQQGYIRGTVKGRDQSTNQPFNLSFDYTYVPIWYGNIPGTWSIMQGTQDTLEIFLAREGEKSGQIDLSLLWNRRNNSTVVTSIGADIAAVSNNALNKYNFYYGFGSPDTAYATNIQVTGDSVITGRLTYIRRSKTPPDTLSAEFSSRIFRAISYQRQTNNHSGSSVFRSVTE
jgi:hypothetical protein